MPPRFDSGVVSNSCLSRKELACRRQAILINIHALMVAREREGVSPRYGLDSTYEDIFFGGSVRNFDKIQGINRIIECRA